MAFFVYPDAATAEALGRPVNTPVRLRNGESMPVFVLLKSLAGPDPTENNRLTTFIRIAMSGEPAPRDNQPTVEVLARASDGSAGSKIDPNTATTVATAVPLFDGTNPAAAARAYFAPPPYLHNVYVLKVLIDIPNTKLAIKITNTTGIDRDFVWVVADGDAEAKQPWVHVTPSTVSFDSVIGQENSPTQIEIANRGTGPVTVNRFKPPTTTYTLTGLPVTLDPNSLVPARSTIRFNAPQTAGETPLTAHTFDTSNKADPGPFGDDHNTLKLSARTRAPEGKLKSFILEKAAVVAGQLVNALIELDHPAGANGATVELSSSAPAIASVFPQTAIVPAGLTRVTFQITTDATTRTNTDVRITAKLKDVEKLVSLKVQVVTLKQFALEKPAVVGGDPVNALIDLDQPVGAGVAAVVITSSRPAVATFSPQIAVVPAAQTRVTFQITTAPITQANVDVVLTAKLNDATLQASLKVQVLTIKAFTLDKTAVLAGQPVNALIELDQPAGTAGARVEVTSSAPGITTFPRIAFVPAGQTQVAFQITTAASAQASVDAIMAAKLNDATRQVSLRVNVIVVKISPNEAHLEVKEGLKFTATVDGTTNQKVRWSVRPSDGGSIGADGSYEAPNRTGRFTVIATSEADPTRTGAAVVEVKFPKIGKESKEGSEGPGKTSLDMIAKLPVRNMWLGAGRPPLMKEGPGDAAVGRSFIRCDERPDVEGPNIVQDLDPPH